MCNINFFHFILISGLSLNSFSCFDLKKLLNHKWVIQLTRNFQRIDKESYTTYWKNFNFFKKMFEVRVYILDESHPLDGRWTVDGRGQGTPCLAVSKALDPSPSHAIPLEPSPQTEHACFPLCMLERRSVWTCSIPSAGDEHEPACIVLCFPVLALRYCDKSNPNISFFKWCIHQIGRASCRERVYVLV